ncbi:B3 domain-containing protein, partial [Cephalotus follicularis]
AREKLFEKAVTSLQTTRSVALKRIVLNFQDLSGKLWKFPLFLLECSQRYALTKGWSPFVKEKNLKPGNVVNFHRLTKRR